MQLIVPFSINDPGFLEYLSKFICVSKCKHGDIHPDIEKLNKIKSDLQDIEYIRIQGAVIRSRINDYELDNRPTQFFYKKEKQNTIQNKIYKIKNSDGHTLNGKENILQRV